MSVMNVRQLISYTRRFREPLKQHHLIRNICPTTTCLNYMNLNLNLNVMGNRMFSDSTITAETKVKQQEVSSTGDGAGAGDASSEVEKVLKSEIEKLNDAIGTLREKKESLEDKYKRALADGENLRTRLTKQIEDAKLFGIQNFCKDMLEVADILDKACESVPQNELVETNPHLKSLYNGLIMTSNQLQKVFKRHGLEQVNPLNEQFDPNLHEALFQQEVNGTSTGIVINVSKIGYKLHDRCIRPALVGVSK